MVVTALVENHAAKGVPGLKTELGLAIHIECPQATILFDAGTSDALIHNAGTLGLNLADVQAVVISHGHYDHMNGLAGFFPLNQQACVYMHSRAAGRYYAGILTFFRKYIGIDPSLLAAQGNRISMVSGDVEIADNIFIVTGLSGKHPPPPDHKFFSSLEDGIFVSDPFDHEVILVIRQHDGLTVFAGGCHRGVLNVIETIRERFPGFAVKTLFCGFHAMRLPVLGIMPGGKVDVRGLARQLRDMMDVKKIYTCHSTSRNVFREMKRLLGEKLDYFPAGCRVDV
jgi:7,8-dihydropterin-6-yl-methyl-4-(beta-D-ribofuranosyl)aminobenzene 5'-phosphate synthase